MKLKQAIKLKEVSTLHTIFRGYRCHEGIGYIFRGQANIAWGLLPKAGRDEFFLRDKPNLDNRDLRRFWVWSRQAVAYIDLPSSELEQLALAQHHGLATRLLDWTMNPLVACFFACFEEYDKDGVVYMYETPDSIFHEEHCIEDIKGFSGIAGYFPRSISPRMINQKGIFTIHCGATKAIEVKGARLSTGETNLIQIVIPGNLKQEVIEMLEDYGIDRSVLFPDLDGLSKYVNAKTSRIAK